MYIGHINEVLSTKNHFQDCLVRPKRNHVRISFSIAWHSWKSFSLYPKLNFASTNFSQWETKIFEQINRKRVGLNLYHWNLWNSCKMQLLRLSQNPTHNKNRPSGHDCHFYPTLKQIITLGIVRTFFVWKNWKTSTEEFYIFSQSCDWLSARKNLRGAKDNRSLFLKQ